jgi:hypothetical protein
MTGRRYRQGDFVFRKGDLADTMFLAIEGKYLVPELNKNLGPGEFGELGLLTSANHRTQSVECVESGRVLTISYDKARELYFENPNSGFISFTSRAIGSCGRRQSDPSGSRISFFLGLPWREMLWDRRRPYLLSSSWRLPSSFSAAAPLLRTKTARSQNNF